MSNLEKSKIWEMWVGLRQLLIFFFFSGGSGVVLKCFGIGLVLRFYDFFLISKVVKNWLVWTTLFGCFYISDFTLYYSLPPNPHNFFLPLNLDLNLKVPYDFLWNEDIILNIGMEDDTSNSDFDIKLKDDRENDEKSRYFTNWKEKI